MPKILIKRGTATQWTNSTTPLLAGELGLDTSNNILKIGNGTTLWNSLAGLTLSAAQVDELAQDAVAAAFNHEDHANIVITYSDSNNKITLSTGPDVVTTTSLNNTLTDSSTGYVPISDVGNVDGVAPLDENSLIPDEYIPSTIARDSEIPSLTGYATETYVSTAISNLVDSAPTTLDTLNELAAALGDDPNYATTITTALGDKVSKSGGDIITSSLPSVIGLTIKGASSQTADLQQWQNSSGSVISLVNSNGFFSLGASTTPGGILGITAILAISRPLVIKAHASQTANLTEWQNGSGTVIAKVDASGAMFTTTAAVGTNTTQVATTEFLQTALGTKLDSSAFTYASITIPVYSTIGDLPSAADNHGRWAHVHGEGAMYFAHGGAWYKALSETNLYVSTNSQGGSYTLATSDLDKMVEMSGGGTLTITDSSSFPVGFTCNILQTGSSQVTIAGSGFTPNATPGLKLRAQWSSATLVKRALNSWVVMGDLSA